MTNTTQDAGPLPSVAELLALSDERDRWSAMCARSERTMYRIGYRAGYGAGYRQGRDDEHAEAAERWRQAAIGLKEHIADTAEAKASVNRRIAAALAGERRDAWEHWRKRWAELYDLSRNPAYVREARSARPWKRSYEQIMALMLADQAASKGGAAA